MFWKKKKPLTARNLIMLCEELAELLDRNKTDHQLALAVREFSGSAVQAGSQYERLRLASVMGGLLATGFGGWSDITILGRDTETVDVEATKRFVELSVRLQGYCRTRWFWLDANWDSEMQ